jgi:hypothetical protein
VSTAEGRTAAETQAYCEGYADALQHALKDIREREYVAYSEGLADGSDVADRVLRRHRRRQQRCLARPGGRR